MDESYQDSWMRARRALRQQLESLQRAGVTQLPKPPEPMIGDVTITPKKPDSRPTKPDSRPQPAAAAANRTPAIPSTSPQVSRQTPTSPVDRQNQLEILQRDVVHCSRCHELATRRTQTVFGVGNPNARLCFFGEAPGADEDRQGEPFVGAAGQLLNKIIEACGLKRDEVYILNVLKCRPPGNRNPDPEEIACCRPFFEQQLAIIQPEFICCLGAVASQTLLRTTQPIGRMRGRFHDYRGIRVIATYHPSYLLRTPSAKRDTWEDMKMLMQAMGIQIPQR